MGLPHDLLNAAFMDLRFFLGTPMDWSGNGNDGSWIASREPEFKRTNDDVVGLYFEDGDVIAAPVSVPGTAFSLEIAFNPRTPFGYGAQPGYLWSTDPTVPQAHASVASDGSITFDGHTSSITTVAGVVKDTVASHVVFIRDASLDGRILHNGVPVATGAVGNGDGDDLYIGNRDLFFDKSFQGTIYLARYWRQELTNEDASRLYEISRPLIRPGSHKRSGIITPAGG